MSKFYARMLAMLALIDKEPALHSRPELAERYNITAWMVTKTFREAKADFDVEVVMIGYGTNKRYKLIDWGGFRGAWVTEKQAQHEALLNHKSK